MQNRFKVGQRVRFTPKARHYLGRSGNVVIISINSRSHDTVEVSSTGTTTFHISWLEPMPFEEYYKQLTR